MTTVETIIFCTISLVYTAIFIILIARIYIKSNEMDKLKQDLAALQETVEQVVDQNESNSILAEDIEERVAALEAKKAKKKTKTEETV